jgi:hypothetical protein
MSEPLRKFQELIDSTKHNPDRTPAGVLKAFVHFLSGLRHILTGCSKEEKEKLFILFQGQQKEFENEMKNIQLDREKLKDPEEMEKLKKQIEGEEFKGLIKKMSEELFEIVKIMAETQKFN